jgi:hypothetical protein
VRRLVAAVFLVATTPAFGAQAIAVSVEELARTSDAVVRGRVATARSRLSDDGRRIFTTYEVRTRTVLKGRAPPFARVVVPGGVVGSFGQRVDGAPVLATGEEVVVFLRRSGGGAFGVAGLAQGKFNVAGSVARPDLTRLAFVSSSVRDGERRAEEMPLAELERRVRSVR